MTREDRRMYWRLGVALFYSFLGLWLVGALFLLWNPPNEMDKQCLGKPYVEAKRCMYEFITRHK